MPNRPDDGRRPTKAERKEQARLERESIQREMAARKRNRTIGFSLLAIAVVVAIAAVVVLRPGSAAEADLPSPAALLEQAAADADAAGCDEAQTTEPYPGDADAVHIEGDERFPDGLPPLETYPSTPPASGPHTGAATLPAGIYDSPPDIGPLIHSLEHGGTVVWYDPEASADALQPIFDFYGQDGPVGQDRVIVAPYDYEGPAGQLPDGVQMALVAWHRMQSCATPSLAVAFDFTSQFSFPTTEDRDYAGEAPEPGAAM